MALAHPILLVGSVPLSGSEAVFRALADRLGAQAPRYPDGETGARSNWIRWQRHIFESNDAFEPFKPAANLAGIKDDLARPFYHIKAGIDPASIDYPPLGFTDEAVRSYGVFSRLKRGGVIPAGRNSRSACRPLSPSSAASSSWTIAPRRSRRWNAPWRAKSPPSAGPSRMAS